jgi:hypothetical protein
VLSAMLAVVVLGVVFIVATWVRIPEDYLIRARTVEARELQRLWDLRALHVSGLVPSLVLVWLQVSVLAAIGVALSTRFSLVVNLPAVILLYIAGNLARFLPAAGQGGILVKVLWAVSQVLPFLQIFDLREHTVYGQMRVPGTHFYNTGTIAVSAVWGYVGIALLYAIAFSTFALAAGMISFSRRELGGAEG